MTSLRHNALALAALMILLAVTIGAAYLDLGVLHTPAAMLIGLIKAAVVVLVFMQIRRSGPLPLLAFSAGIFWVIILIVLTLGDYLTRTGPAW